MHMWIHRLGFSNHFHELQKYSVIPYQPTTYIVYIRSHADLDIMSIPSHVERAQKAQRAQLQRACKKSTKDCLWSLRTENTCMRSWDWNDIYCTFLPKDHQNLHAIVYQELNIIALIYMSACSSWKWRPYCIEDAPYIDLWSHGHCICLTLTQLQ